MCSGNGSNFENIVHSCPDHEVVIMVYNKKKAKAKKRADRLDINSCYSKDEDEIIALFDAYNVDLVVMAGWMRIVSKKFCDAFAGQVINLHPSLLPAFTGLNAPKQALEYGARYAGCTVHYVDDGVDTGPIILQGVVDVVQNDDEESLLEKIHQKEHEILPKAIQLIAEGKINRIEGRRVFIDNDF